MEENQLIQEFYSEEGLNPRKQGNAIPSFHTETTAQVQSLQVESKRVMTTLINPYKKKAKVTPSAYERNTTELCSGAFDAVPIKQVGNDANRVQIINGPPSSNMSHLPIMPEKLTPPFLLINNIASTCSKFFQTMKCAVLKKEEMKQYENNQGPGQRFSVMLIDESGVDIKATFFNKAASKFDALLQERKLYTFRKGRINRANTKYNRSQSYFEIVFDVDAEISEEVSPCDCGEEVIKKGYIERRNTRTMSCATSLAVKDPKHDVLISMLSLEQQDGWNLHARLTSKSANTTWTTTEGKDSSVFSIELTDASGADIKGVFFSDAADEFYDELEVGESYKFSRAYLKPANKSFATSSSEIEIVFAMNSIIHLLPSTHPYASW